MRALNKALLPIVALVLVPLGSAGAQKYYSRGTTLGTSAGRPLPAHRGYGSFGVPGIFVGPPPGGSIDDRPPPRRRSAQRPSNAPSANEHRYVPDEVVIEVANSMSPARIDALQRRYRLTLIESHRFVLSDATLLRWRIPDRRSVANVVRALERDRAVAAAQPNYLYALQQDGVQREGDQAQYALAKLHLPQAHRLANGGNVLVAVVDSGIDATNPELAGSVVDSFEAIRTSEPPNKHGTSIAGLIAAHGRLMGVAPAARILSVRVFGPTGSGTTFGVLMGLDWAASHGARIINMSFAGPADPMVRHTLAAAYRKGIVLVAAAGNAGPDSPPLYPAAYPDVIAVTATDADNRLFPQSNRGHYIAVAAPGADILVAIPDGAYEVGSGTSYAAAEVSGIVALMLQHDPALGPEQARHILLTTAKDLGPRGRDDEFGAGLADAFGALSAEKPPPARTNVGER